MAQKALQQNKAKEKLAIDVLKENEKLKLTNQILKNRISLPSSIHYFDLHLKVD